jgi:hypothetical protein
MSSLYQDYKNSTSQFQKWILKTSARKGLPNTLNFLRVHVQNIVQNAATLRKQKAFFGDLKGAISNGRAAIKARKAVHLTKVNEIPKSVSPEEYQKYLETNGKHAHCIRLLQECWDILSRLVPVASNSDRDKKVESEKQPTISSESLAKKFSSLEVQDLPEEHTAALHLPVDEEIDLDTLDLQYGDIRLRVVCFFIEMTQLDEYLSKIWKRVQNLEISIPSAAVVTISAMQKVKLMESELSIIFPSYSNAVAFFAAFKQFLSPMEMANIAEHPTYQLLSIVMEFYTSYGGHLGTAKYPFSERSYMVRQRGACNDGKVYNECNMPSIGSDRTSIMWFLDTEVTVFYNALIYMKDCFGHDYNSFLEYFHTRPGHLTIAGYVREFINFFDTRNQTTTLLFITFCWIRSIQCMADTDRLTLSKSIYLYRSFIRQRNTNFQIHSEELQQLVSILNSNAVNNALKSFSKLRSAYNDKIQWLCNLESWTVHHNHPLLVGGYFLDTVFTDQSLCCELITKFYQFHKFIPWFYLALKESQLFVDGEIPFIENYAKLVERIHSFKHVSNDPPSPRYVSFLCKCFTEDGYSAALNNGLIPKAMEKMSLAPKDVSSLYSVLTMDDFSCFKAESFHSNEGLDELISITERELLESSYLSVDLLKYFISFNHFIIYLHERQSQHDGITPNPIKAWYATDYPKCHWTIFQWSQHIFFPFLAEYLKSNVKKRTSQDSAKVDYFIQSMKLYFNDQSKDSQEYGEKTFIIDSQFTNNWREIYSSCFRESYSLGMNEILNMIPSLPTSALQEYSDFNNDFWKAANLLNSENLSKLKIVSIAKKFVSDHIASIIASERSGSSSSFLLMTLTDPVIHDQELAEYVFVTFGCFLYLSNVVILKNALFEVASKGNSWSMDLLMSITSVQSMVVQDGSTGDTVFHKLAKQGHLKLLQYILLLGYLPVLIDITGERQPGWKNNEGKPFTTYIQDPIKRQWCESRFVDFFDTRFKNVAAERRKTGEFNPQPMTQYLDRFRSQEGTLFSSLKRDAREETVKTVQKQIKKGKGGNKSQAILQEVTQEDEEKAKQSEQELLAMLEGVEKQPTKVQEKSKKKHSK